MAEFLTFALVAPVASFGAIAVGERRPTWDRAPGRVLADYHTAQVPPSRGKRRFATRAQELAAPDLATILSRRDYRTDAWHLERYRLKLTRL